MQPPSDDQFLAWLCAKDFKTFIEQAWPIIEPATAYKPNWHIDEIAEHLEAVSSGEIKRLLVNVPPRHSKSTIISVLWPAWEWLSNPGTQFLCTSYAQTLATQDSVKCRSVVQSTGGLSNGTLLERVGYVGLLKLLGRDWDLEFDQNQKTRFDNTERGYRIASSVGGTVTGLGGGVVIVDDPNSADEADYPNKLKAVREWLDGTLSTRLNDPSTGRIVVVQQRIHEDDATGHLLKKGGYTHLCLPAEYEIDHPHRSPHDHRVSNGELLWPKHFDRTAIDQLKVSLGSRKSSGQLQQNPTPSEGGMFKRDWWQKWPAGVTHTGILGFEDQLHLGWDYVVQSWDFRFKDSKTDGDWVVGQLWGFHGANSYLLGQIRGRFSFVESLAAFHAFQAWGERWYRPGMAKLIEDKANGPAIRSALKEVGQISGIIPIQVSASDSKEARAAAVSPRVEAGNVFLPPGDFIPGPTEWTDEKGKRHEFTLTSVDDFVEEHAVFPLGSHDDQVDGMSQALNWKRPKARQEAPKQSRPAARPLAAGVMRRAV